MADVLSNLAYRPQYGQSVTPEQIDFLNMSSGAVPTENYGMSVAPMDSTLSQVNTNLTTPSSGFSLGGFLPSKDVNGVTTGGWGGMALGAVQGIGNMYMGMKQFGLAKEQLKNSKEQFAMNYGAQRTMTNNALRARGVAQAASREGAPSNPYAPIQLVA